MCPCAAEGGDPLNGEDLRERRLLAAQIAEPVWHESVERVGLLT